MGELVGSRLVMLPCLSGYLKLLQPVIITGPPGTGGLSLTKAGFLPSGISGVWFLQ